MTRVRPWHWLTGLAAAILIHAIALIQFPHQRPEAPSPGLDGIMVSLGNTGTSPMEGPKDGAEDPILPEADQGSDRKRELPPGDRTVAHPESVPPPVAAPSPIAPPRPGRKPVPPAVAEPAPPRPAPPPPTPQPEAKLAERIPSPEPAVTNPPLEAPPQALTPDRLIDARQAAPDTPPADPRTASLPIYVSQRLGAIGGGAVWLKGEPPKDAGMVPWGSDYWARLLSWLREHGRYPRQAIPRRLEGEALLEFVIDRSGKVLTYRLLKSTGHFILDREAKEMIRFADPVPALPDSFPDEAMHVVLPVIFEVLS